MKKLLPPFNKTNLNKYIKQLLEQAGFIQPVQKVREKRGQGIDLLKLPYCPAKKIRFCDVASTSMSVVVDLKNKTKRIKER